VSIATLLRGVMTGVHMSITCY